MNEKISRMLIAGSLLAVLTACGSNTAATQSTASSDAPAVSVTVVTQAQATQAEAQPQATTAPQANAAPSNAPAGLGVMGTVTAVSGDALTIQDQRQQGTYTVKVSSDTQIFKQVATQLSAIAAGEKVTVVGEQTDTAFTASQIRVGDTSMTAGAPPQGQPPQGQPPANDGTNPPPQGNAPQGQPPAGGPGGQAMSRLSGTVTQVSTNGLTLQTTDGNTVQVTLGNNASIASTVAGALSDIAAGVQIRASGAQADNVLTATRIDVVPAMQQP